MKALLVIMLLVTTSAYADDVLVLRKGVRFNHIRHQGERVGVCAVCHEQQAGMITNFGQRWAHKNCIGCHDLYHEGPTVCGGCHTRV